MIVMANCKYCPIGTVEIPDDSVVGRLFICRGCGMVTVYDGRSCRLFSPEEAEQAVSISGFKEYLEHEYVRLGLWG